MDLRRSWFLREHEHSAKWKGQEDYWSARRGRAEDWGWEAFLSMNGYHENPIGCYGGCPWRYDKRYDAMPILALHEEINDFYDYISPTPEEHFMRLNVVENIRGVIQGLWPASVVEVFGSFRTGLYLPTGDVDLVVIGDWQCRPLRTLEAALLNQGVCDPDNIRVVDKATVPIIKLTDRSSGIKVDISFNTSNGVRSVHLIKEFKAMYPPLGRLVLVLKQFMAQRDLNEVFHGGISSYALILMVVSFLQLHPRGDGTKMDANLGVLLLEFFELYGNKFDYSEKGIRISGGGSYFDKWEHLQRWKVKSRPNSVLSIEDPLDPSNDIGRVSYAALRAKEAFQCAYIALSRAVNPLQDAASYDPKTSILAKVVLVPDRVVHYRGWVRHAFPARRQAVAYVRCFNNSNREQAKERPRRRCAAAAALPASA